MSVSRYANNTIHCLGEDSHAWPWTLPLSLIYHGKLSTALAMLLFLRPRIHSLWCILDVAIIWNCPRISNKYFLLHFVVNKHLSQNRAYCTSVMIVIFLKIIYKIKNLFGTIFLMFKLPHNYGKVILRTQLFKAQLIFGYHKNINLMWWSQSVFY